MALYQTSLPLHKRRIPSQLLYTPSFRRNAAAAEAISRSVVSIEPLISSSPILAAAPRLRGLSTPPPHAEYCGAAGLPEAMSAGVPGLTAGNVPSSSLGHSRGRGHTRSSYREHAPSPLQLPPVDQQPALEQVSQPATGSVEVNGHASGPASHGHSHSHSYSHPLHPPTPLHDASFHYGATGDKASGPIAPFDRNMTLGPTENGTDSK